jgi:hypothetical protein
MHGHFPFAKILSAYSILLHNVPCCVGLHVLQFGIIFCTLIVVKFFRHPSPPLPPYPDMNEVNEIHKDNKFARMNHKRIKIFGRNYISYSALRQVHSFFQSEVSTECDVVLPVSVSIILSFPRCHRVTAYIYIPRLPATSSLHSVFPSIRVISKINYKVT